MNQAAMLNHFENLIYPNNLLNLREQHSTVLLCMIFQKISSNFFYFQMINIVLICQLEWTEVDYLMTIFK